MILTRSPDEAAVVRGIDAELGLAQGPVDVLHDRGIVRLHREHPRLWRGDERDLLQRHRRSIGVDVDVNVVEEGRAGLAGADAGHLRGDEVGGFLHRFFSFEQEGFEVHGGEGGEKLRSEESEATFTQRRPCRCPLR
jgi:hypothetical protein